MSAGRERLAAFGVAVSIVVGVIAAVTVVGQVARAPVVLTIFFSGMAAGASLASLVRRRGLRQTARAKGGGGDEAV